VGDTISVLSSAEVGTVQFSQFLTNQPDTCRIGGHNYYWGIYLGDQFSTILADVSATWTAVKNDVVTTSGAYSGQIDGWTVAATNICIVVSPANKSICYLDRATHPSANLQGGDSGGPVVKNVGGSWRASGTLTAMNTHTAYFQTINSVIPSGWQIGFP
jgi:hypothetical protein